MEFSLLNLLFKVLILHSEVATDTITLLPTSKGISKKPGLNKSSK